MLAHRGFSAWITVDDEALPEYLVAVDDEDHRVSCWIPGEEGKVRRAVETPHRWNIHLSDVLTRLRVVEIYGMVDRPWRPG